MFKKYIKNYFIQSQQIPYFSIWNSKIITVISESVNHEITFATSIINIKYIFLQKYNIGDISVLPWNKKLIFGQKTVNFW